MSESKEIYEKTTSSTMTDKAPKILLEILVYGVESEKPKIKKMLDNIQEQLSKTKYGKKARVLWYIDKGEKTDEEKKQWLIDNANCIHYIFTNQNHTVTPTFVKDTVLRIKNFHKALTVLKNSNIKFSKNKNDSIVTELPSKPELKVVE